MPSISLNLLVYYRKAAWLTIFSKSAPVKPVVPLANNSTSISLAKIFPKYNPNISLRPVKSGVGTVT